jgi:type I restriction enzyme M protein
LLDPDCIECKGWNLSAGQYKPFAFVTTKSEKSVVEMIGNLKRKEQKILEGLDALLVMVEGE